LLRQPFCGFLPPLMQFDNRVT